MRRRRRFALEPRVRARFTDSDRVRSWIALVDKQPVCDTRGRIIGFATYLTALAGARRELVKRAWAAARRAKTEARTATARAVVSEQRSQLFEARAHQLWGALQDVVRSGHGASKPRPGCPCVSCDARRALARIEKRFPLLKGATDIQEATRRLRGAP